MALLQVGFVPARRSHFRITRRDRSLAHSLRLGVLALLAVVLLGSAPGPARAAAPEGQLTWGVHVSLAPPWFDPAETQGIITPFMVMYALHDAMVKPMPGKPFAPSLAESWTMSQDGLTYEFVLRKGVKFHDGEPVTAEDVKFSFERYRGTSAKAIKDRVAAIEAPDPQQVRFKLKAPWPDFLTFYASATGAGWVVPKKYVEKVGDEGLQEGADRRRPLQVRLVQLRASSWCWRRSTQYWRKTPNVKRLVFKSIPDEATRLAALKRGEIDIVYSIRGELAEELERTQGPRAQARGHQRPILALLPRAVGPQIAMARPARAAGREPRDRPQDHQPGTVRSATPSSPAASIPDSFEYLLAAPGACLRSGHG